MQGLAHSKPTINASYADRQKFNQHGTLMPLCNSCGRHSGDTKNNKSKALNVHRPFARGFINNFFHLHDNTLTCY